MKEQFGFDFDVPVASPIIDAEYQEVEEVADPPVEKVQTYVETERNGQIPLIDIPVSPLIEEIPKEIQEQKEIQLNRDQLVFFEELTWEQSPVEFPEFDENIETEYECASCQYRWSGGEEDENVDVEKSLKTCPRCGVDWQPPEIPSSLVLFSDLVPGT